MSLSIEVENFETDVLIVGGGAMVLRTRRVKNDQ